jgi:FtsP/CotA-like multicopper oxidase with cupredoxin domain
MSTQALLVLDLLTTILVAGAWVGAAISPGRAGKAAITVAALVLTGLRVLLVGLLAQRGWAFAQEKALLSLPLLVLPAIAVVAFPRRASPVIAAACGAVAGVVVTFVVGYPATLFNSVIVVALTVAVFLLIAGHLRPVAVGMLAGALLAGPGSAVLTTFTAPLHGLDASPLRLASSQGQVTRFELTAGRLASGAWGFNGQTPGPVLRAVRGDTIEVLLRNTDIEEGVTLHWHGYPVPNGDDGVAGVTQDAVRPGQEFVYRFTADKAGTFWYHTHQVSHLGVKKGLFGALIVQERPEAGEEILVYAHRLVTGATSRALAAGTPVTLRLINADDVTHRFLLTGVSWRLSAVDGTDLDDPSPVTGKALRLAAGGRYDVRFTMPEGPVRLALDGRPSLGLSAPAAAVDMRVPDLDLFAYGRPGNAAPVSFDREYTVVLDRQLRLLGTRPAYAYTVNGRTWPQAPELRVHEGERVRLTVVNRDREAHPMHPHGHQVLVLSRNGIAPSGSPLWMDSYEVLPGQTWEVALSADNPGVWMAHCHHLQHAAEGMMLHLTYDGLATDFHHRGDNHPE